MPYTDYIEQLKEELGKKLPGEEVQLKMAPAVRLQSKTRTATRKAAVLILLYPDGQALSTVFIRRSRYFGMHSGQIGLPGGKMEQDDADVNTTALREAEEEIGINRHDVTILGGLSQLLIKVSNVLVFPVVGYIPYKPSFNPDLSEVDGIIETPIEEFFRKEVIQNKIEKIFFRKVSVPFYNINGNHIWGATAMIISEFIELLQRIKSGR